MEKKKPIGFSTPSMKIQDEYMSILKELLKKKADWDQILSLSNRLLEKTAGMVIRYINNTKNKEKYTDMEMIELEHKILNYGQSVITQLIAKIGKEFSECDVRISGLEKGLKDIKRAVK